MIEWHVPNDNQLFFEEWEDEAVVYNSKSGETHRLNDLAASLLKIIQRQPGSINLFTEQVNNLYEVEDQLDLERQLNGLISQFDTLGLIEPLVE